ncbi:MAG TPA: glycoside hydrolase [Candidatus Hydrogenedentes bacterium]|nr:glycoside hydrolase [Candidatus Hydrogenedentota bacterium]
MLEPPATEDIILLPQPRMARFEPGMYASDKLTPQEILRLEAVPHEQGYILSITPEAIRMTARDAAGLFYARQTLEQLRRQFANTGKLPVAHIEDWPDFPNRGAMLDVARDKVPTMETLFDYVDMFASLKFNQLQLYTEHTFAYPGHGVVWQNASPMTPEQIRELDAYCRERHIELVPNQNSFGHMGRWLQHDAYKHLAEIPGGADLCPTHPGSIGLLRDMYDSLLPNFSSGQVNVGCDETFSLGKGGSKADVERIGKGRVYLNFLKQIHGLAREHGKVMQFWGDIILEHPELIPELPDNIIAMEWGYEANHPFAARGSKFAASGVPFYVCPGTSSWNSLLSRTNNALENLRLAARNGLDNGAIGYLVTDWGDSGHWQFKPISFVPFAWGAALCWAYDANVDLNLAKAVDTHVFRDCAGVMAQAAMDLGAAHARTGVMRGNSTVYYGLLMHALQGSPATGYLKGMTLYGLRACRAQLEEALERMSRAQMNRDDAELILAEFEMNACMALFAVRLGEERLKAGGVGTAQLPADARALLSGELDQIITEYKTLWLARNRPGGLGDSVARLETVLRLLSR